MQPVSISTEIKMFNVAVMLDLFASLGLRGFSFVPFIQVNSAVMCSNRKDDSIWRKLNVTDLFFADFVAPFRF